MQRQRTRASAPPVLLTTQDLAEVIERLERNVTQNANHIVTLRNNDAILASNDQALHNNANRLLTINSIN